MKKVIVIIEMLVVIVLSVVTLMLGINISQSMHGTEFDSKYEDYNSTSSKWIEPTTVELSVSEISSEDVEETAEVEETEESSSVDNEETTGIVDESSEDETSETRKVLSGEEFVEQWSSATDEENVNTKEYTAYSKLNNVIQNIMDTYGYENVEILTVETMQDNVTIYASLSFDGVLWNAWYYLDTDTAKALIRY